MFALLIIPILLAGYTVCSTHPVIRQKLYRFEGQHLYLKVVCQGVFQVLIATTLLLIINSLVLFLASFCPPLHQWLLDDPFAQPLQDFFNVSPEISRQILCFLVLTIFSFLVARSFSGIATKRLKKEHGDDWKSQVSLEVLRDSPLDFLLLESALTQGSLLILSMENRKVYVCAIQRGAEPGEHNKHGEDQEVSVIPVKSGYRDKDTLEVYWTTYYDAIAEKVTIVLRQADIVSASRYDVRMHEELVRSKKVQGDKNKSTPLQYC